VEKYRRIGANFTSSSLHEVPNVVREVPIKVPGITTKGMKELRLYAKRLAFFTDQVGTSIEGFLAGKSSSEASVLEN